MRCDEFETHIQRLADERSPQAAWQPLRNHARRCRRCRETLAAYEAVLEWAATPSNPELDPDFTQRVLNRVADTHHRRNAGWHYVAAVAIAASLLVAALAGWRGRGSSTPSLPPPADRSVVVEKPREDATPGTADRLAPENRSPAASPQYPTPTGSAELLASADELREVLVSWSGTWRARWQPVDPLAEGIRPIAASVTVAFDQLRSALPLVPPRSSAEPADSAMFQPACCCQGWV